MIPLEVLKVEGSFTVEFNDPKLLQVIKEANQDFKNYIKGYQMIGKSYLPQVQLKIKVNTAIAICKDRPNTRILFVANRVDQVEALIKECGYKFDSLYNNEVKFDNGSKIVVRNYNIVSKIKTKYTFVVIDDCLSQQVKNLAKGLEL